MQVEPSWLVKKSTLVSSSTLVSWRALHEFGAPRRAAGSSARIPRGGSRGARGLKNAGSQYSGVVHVGEATGGQRPDEIERHRGMAVGHEHVLWVSGLCGPLR